MLSLCNLKCAIASLVTISSVVIPNLPTVSLKLKITVSFGINLTLNFLIASPVRYSEVSKTYTPEFPRSFIEIHLIPVFSENHSISLRGGVFPIATSDISSRISKCQFWGITPKSELIKSSSEYSSKYLNSFLNIASAIASKFLFLI